MATSSLNYQNYPSSPTINPGGKRVSSVLLDFLINQPISMSQLLLLLFITLTAAAFSSAPPPVMPPHTTPPVLAPSVASFPPPTAAVPPPSQAPQRHHHNQQQLNNIIDALIGSGDFNSWADILSAADEADIPLSATLFIPADDALPSSITIEPFVLLYHIIPQRLSFSDLLLLRPLSRIPTLLPSKTILLTNNSLSNFTLDDRLLSHPDLHTTHSVAVHGISSLLDYSVYGDGMPTSLPTTTTPKPPSNQTPPSPPGMLNPLPVVDQLRSDASCFLMEFWIVLLVIATAFFGD